MSPIMKTPSKSELNDNASMFSKRTKSVAPERPGLIKDVWNQKYADALTSKGPTSVKAMNQGTSFLVAPIYT